MGNSEEKKIHYKGIAFGIAVFWIAITTLVYSLSDKNFAVAGTIGDSFGAVNALFSGFAFAGVIVAILLQKNELELQRQELKSTREVLNLQKEEMEAQNETNKLHRFENTFFQMLDLHHNIVEKMFANLGRGNVLEGRRCFTRFYSEFKRAIRPIAVFPGGDELERIRDAYHNFYPQHQTELGHYFRNLYQIIKFVNNSTVQDKKRYTNIVRAQLSSHEQALLFYNCLSDQGSEKFKPLIERYTLLKHLPINLLEADEYVEFYDRRAFQSEGVAE